MKKIIIPFKIKSNTFLLCLSILLLHTFTASPQDQASTQAGSIESTPPSNTTLEIDPDVFDSELKKYNRSIKDLAKEVQKKIEVLDNYNSTHQEINVLRAEKEKLEKQGRPDDAKLLQKKINTLSSDRKYRNFAKKELQKRDREEAKITRVNKNQIKKQEALRKKEIARQDREESKRNRLKETRTKKQEALRNKEISKMNNRRSAKVKQAKTITRDKKAKRPVRKNNSFKEKNNYASELFDSGETDKAFEEWRKIIDTLSEK